MSDDLVAFLRARLDEDEASVRALTVPHQWHTGPGGDPEWTDEELVCMWPPEFHTPYERDKHWRGITISEPGLAAYVARHDPERVLAEVAAKRAIVDAYLPPGADPHPGLPCTDDIGGDPDGEAYAEMPPAGRDACVRHLEASKRLLHDDYVLRLLALPYARHPDYRPEWTPDT